MNETTSVASRQSTCYVTVDDEEDTHFDIRNVKAMRKSWSFSNSRTASAAASKKVTTPKSKTVDEKVYLLLKSKR